MSKLAHVCPQSKYRMHVGRVQLSHILPVLVAEPPPHPHTDTIRLSSHLESSSTEHTMAALESFNPSRFILDV